MDNQYSLNQTEMNIYVIRFFTLQIMCFFPVNAMDHVPFIHITRENHYFVVNIFVESSMQRNEVE